MTDERIPMTIGRTCLFVAVIVPLTGAVGASAIGCNSSPDAFPIEDGGADAIGASDGTVVESGAGDAQPPPARTLKLTWEIVTASPAAAYVGYDGGGVGAGGAEGTGSDGGLVDAGSDAAPVGDAASDGSPGDAMSSAEADAEAGAVDDGGTGAADTGAVAASDGGADAGASSGSADAGGPTGSPDAGGNATQPVAGLRVCVYQDPTIPCVMSDATGKFTLAGLPMMSDVVVSMTKTGYLPVLLPIETGSTDMDGSPAGPFPMTASATSSASSVPTTVDLIAKGMLVFFAIMPDNGSLSSVVGAIGTKVSLSPMDGSGPFFQTNHSAIDPSATSVVDQNGFYFNLDPGTYQLTFADPHFDCAPLSTPFGFGFPSPPSAVKFPIAAGYETAPVGVLCTPQSVIVNTGDAN
jgi:hypothetical protein